MHTYAVRHYERVLELAEKKGPHVRISHSPEEQTHTIEHYLQDCGLAREAAYNLSLIYVMTGAAPLAEALYRRWLSI